MNLSSHVCSVDCEPPIPLCSLRPPPFPSCWVNDSLIGTVVNSPEWKLYTELCLNGTAPDIPEVCRNDMNEPPEASPSVAEASLGWIAAPILLTLLLILAIIAFFLYKKKIIPPFLPAGNSWQPDMHLYRDVNYLDNKNRNNELWSGHKKQEVAPAIQCGDPKAPSQPQSDTLHVQTSKSTGNPPQNLSHADFDTILSISSTTMAAPRATHLNTTDLAFPENPGIHNDHMTVVGTSSNIDGGPNTLTPVLTPNVADGSAFPSRKGLANPAFQSDNEIKTPDSELPRRLPPLGRSESTNSSSQMMEETDKTNDQNDAPKPKRRKKKNILRGASVQKDPPDSNG